MLLVEAALTNALDRQGLLVLTQNIAHHFAKVYHVEGRAGLFDWS